MEVAAPGFATPLSTSPPSAYEIGLLLGVLIGEGTFGGDGRQPAVTLRMHVRHEQLFRWAEQTFPGGRLYGPYTHGGRHYYQWVARGDYLRRVLAPLIAGRIDTIDNYAADRFYRMCRQYAIDIPQPGRLARGIPTEYDDGGSGVL